MDVGATVNPQNIHLEKFQNPGVTADGKLRAVVGLKKLQMLWINTGTLCNLSCPNCYIESSPTNNRLAYITTSEVRCYLDEIIEENLGTREIGFTGGEPFMNPDFVEILDLSLSRGFLTLILTNGMKPMQKAGDKLICLNKRYSDQLTVRLSLDHYESFYHEMERGSHTWSPALEGLSWLSQNNFKIRIAGRTFWKQTEAELREGYAELFSHLHLKLDAWDPTLLVLFPEIDEDADVPEISNECWGLLEVSPESMMCASSRMVIKRRGLDTPTVVPCTLLPYDERFDLGSTLASSNVPVPLNHPHCAKFCVLGGGSCGTT
tara:strand:- start:31 stop:990 length:960 start_codon:yes stop_codon:yes gene_type:complete